jgi:hypothetical protein
MAANAADERILAMARQPVSAPNREEMESVLNPFCSRLTTGSMVNKQKLVEEALGKGSTLSWWPVL